MDIKVFGERNTGTNALIRMLQQNSKTRFYPGTRVELSQSTSRELELIRKFRLGSSRKERAIDRVFQGRSLLERWKHSATYVSHAEVSDLPETLFIFTVREPLSWLVGLYKKPYHILTARPENLESFATTRWRTVGRENLQSASYYPLDLFEEKLKSYLHLMSYLEDFNLPFKIIKFENFVTDQEATFWELYEFLDEPTCNFGELNESTKDSRKNARFYANYYTNGLWKADFPELDDLKMTVSKDLLSSFGY